MAAHVPEEDRLNTLESENERLRAAIQELSVINDLTQEIGGTKDLNEILATIIQRSRRAVHAEQCVIILVDAARHDAAQTLVRTMVTTSEHEPLHVDQSLVGWMYINKQPLLINSPRTDARFSGVRWADNLQSILCVPLLVKSKLTGVLVAYNRNDHFPFNDANARLLSIISGQSAQIIENARLYSEEQALRRVEEELRMAYEIQARLLPKEPPRIEGYTIAGRSIPAKAVGGDYFDYFPLTQPNTWAFCLGDVSGKGLPAALLMAHLQATLRGQALNHPQPSTCLWHANRLLYESTDTVKFVTLVYGMLDTVSHRFVYTNAGHNPPFLFRGKEHRLLGTGGLILGILPQAAYEEEALSLLPGDLMVLYSDGVTESLNEAEHEFGETRFTDLLAQHVTLDPHQLIERILVELEGHRGSVPPSDDVSLLVIRRDD